MLSTGVQLGLVSTTLNHRNHGSAGFILRLDIQKLKKKEEYRISNR
jgi:hypothetical protein